MTIYKFRAESIYDVFLFFLKLDHNRVSSSIQNLIYEKWRFGADCDIEFECNYTKDELLDILRTIDNSHVIMQTINPKDLYLSLIHI